jgi:hypothetical protein
MKGALSWRRAGEGIWATPRGAVLGEAAAPVEVRRTEPMPPGTAQPGMVVMGTIRPTLVLAAAVWLATTAGVVGAAPARR